MNNDTALWHPFADMATVRRHELVMDRAEDVWIHDEHGNRYLDATAGLWYCNVGHGRREIVDAIARQLHRLDSYQVFGDLAHRPALDLAERLVAAAPMPSRVFLTSGGGDSIDTACKLARRYWVEHGRPERTAVVSRTNGYHGTHGFGTALHGIRANAAGFGPQLEAYQVDHADADALEGCITRVGADRIAAFVVEPVIAAGGVHPPPAGYLDGVFDICRRHRVLVIVDAVVCGFGRLGSWYGIERFHQVPDMIVFAKGVTSGYQPLGGVVVSDEVCAPFWSTAGGPAFRHGPTYSAHPAACAAALANLDILADGLLEAGRALELDLHRAVQPLADHAAVAEVRGGLGLLAAVELDPQLLAAKPAAAAELAARARTNGVLVRPLAGGVAVSPPLTVQPAHLELVQHALTAGLDQLA